MTRSTPAIAPTAAMIGGYLKVHRYLEARTDELVAAVRHLPTDRVAEAGQGIQRAWDRFGSLIEHHHHTEDERFFPLLASVDPTFADDLVALEGDHRALDQQIGAVTEAIGWLGAGDPAARAEALDAVEALAGLLGDHLAAEEAVVLPRTPRVGDDEAADFLRYVQRSQRPSEGIPFAVDAGMTTVDDLPAPIRALARRVWIPRYERDLTSLSPVVALV